MEYNLDRSWMKQTGKEIVRPGQEYKISIGDKVMLKLDNHIFGTVYKVDEYGYAHFINHNGDSVAYMKDQLTFKVKD